MVEEYEWEETYEWILPYTMTINEAITVWYV